MAKYKKKPVIIEAFQYDGDLKDRNGVYYVPDWFVSAFEDGVARYGRTEPEAPQCEMMIKTLEGDMHVSVGDYVIRGVNGEIYPCKPDIFEKTYEPVREF